MVVKVAPVQILVRFDCVLRMMMILKDQGSAYAVWYGRTTR